MPLGQLRAVRAENHRHVRIHRRFRAQRQQHVHLPRGVVEVIVAANDMSYVHVHVVDNHTEVIGGSAVGPGDDQVIELCVLERYRSVDQVLDDDGAVSWIAEPHDGADAFARGRAIAADACVARLLLPRDLLLAHRVQLLLGAVAVIGSAVIQHAADDFLVAIESLGLVVRTLVGIEVAPFHAIEDHPHRFIGGPLAVGVLDAQDEFAAHAPGIEPAEKRRPDAAYVQHAGGTGGKAGNYSHGAEDSLQRELAKPLILLVRGTGIEPVAPAV